MVKGTGPDDGLPGVMDPVGERMEALLHMSEQLSKLKNGEVSANAETTVPGSANEFKEGCAHYKVETGKEEHWDRMWRLFGPGWFIGNITKYAERVMDKGQPHDDLRKVQHYARKLDELITAAENGTGPQPGRWPSLLKKVADDTASSNEENDNGK